MLLVAPIARLVLVLLLSLPLAGNRSRNLPVVQTSQTIKRSPELQKLMNEGNAAFRGGNPQRAYFYYKQGWDRADSQKDVLNAACFLAGIGNTYLVTHRYNEALRAYQQAKTGALQANYPELATIVTSNWATLYRKIDAINAAELAMKEIQAVLPATASPALLMQVANLAADHGDRNQAEQYYFAAIDQAVNTVNISDESLAWNRLGYFYMKEGDLPRADDALSRAFRLRVLSKNRRIGASFVYLAMLRLQQQRPEDALKLLDAALSIKASELPVSRSYISYLRAKALAASGDLDGALIEFDTTVRLARDWRDSVLPSDTFRISADVSLQRIFDDLIEIGMRRYGQSGNPLLAKRLFAVAELNRAASLRQKLNLDELLPPEYAVKLEKFRRRLLASGKDQNSAEADRLRLELAEEEAKLGFDESWQHLGKQSHQKKERNIQENLLRHLQDRLKQNEAFLSFHAADSSTLLWAVTQNSFEMHVLKGRKDLSAEISAFQAAIRLQAETTGSKSKLFTSEAGKRLFHDLFGKLSREAAEKPSWILSVEDRLHELPFAALPAPEKRGIYLVETKSLRYVPSATLIQSSGRQSFAMPYIAFADPVYNTADSRWTGTGEFRQTQYARLPGTVLETKAIADNWQTGGQTFLGNGVTRENVRSALQSRPEVVHFATHVLADPRAADTVSIAMGIRANGTNEFLAPSDIAAWRNTMGLVVLSGCGSGTGQSLPGAGLIGLTRSWLLAGAQSVVATYWPIPDNAESFFRTFYRELRTTRSPGAAISASLTAEALRTAQIAALRSGGRDANPGYWAAFFVVGRD